MVYSCGEASVVVGPLTWPLAVQRRAAAIVSRERAPRARCLDDADDLAAAPPETPQSSVFGGQLDREGLEVATLSGARWVGVSRLVAELFALATTVVLARLISPAEYGTAVVVLILPMLASILTYEGFGAFLVQTRTCTREHVGSAVSSRSRAACC